MRGADGCPRADPQPKDRPPLASACHTQPFAHTPSKPARGRTGGRLPRRSVTSRAGTGTARNTVLFRCARRRGWPLPHALGVLPLTRPSPGVPGAFSRRLGVGPCPGAGHWLRLFQACAGVCPRPRHGKTAMLRPSHALGVYPALRPGRLLDQGLPYIPWGSIPLRSLRSPAWPVFLTDVRVRPPDGA